MKIRNYSKVIISGAVILLVFIVGYLTGSASKVPSSAGGGHFTQATARGNTSKTDTPHSYRPTPDEINADMRQRGLLASADASDFNSLSDDFEITGYALDIAGIPPTQRNDVQSYFDEVHEALEALVISRITVNQSKSDPSLGVYELDVPAFTDDGESLVSSLSQKLTEAYGKGAAKLLISGLHPDRMVTGFGKFDTKIHILPQDSTILGQDRQMWKIVLRDPKSGKVVRTRTMTTFDEVEKHFGENLANDILALVE